MFRTAQDFAAAYRQEDEFASRVVPHYKGLTYGIAQPATVRGLAQAYEQKFQSSLQAYEGHITDDNLTDDCIDASGGITRSPDLWTVTRFRVSFKLFFDGQEAC